jgi:hypothetical protein
MSMSSKAQGPALRALKNVTTAAICVALLVSPASTQETTLDAVLARAGAYVVEFQRQLSGIVAEEAYTQDVTFPPILPRQAMPAQFGPKHRVLKSDLLLIRPQGSDRWVQFRDVFEVDGRPVRDRNERLMKLFLEPTTSTANQVGQIVTESARYNIGSMMRNVNVPVLSLIMLDPVNQPRFRFKRTRDRRARLAPASETPGDSAAANFRTATEIWVVEYQEVQHGTIIRTNNQRDLPSRGRFWIEPASGRVLMSELMSDDPAFHAVIDVSYQSEPIVDMLVPVEMRESYEMRSDGTYIGGKATYGKFRPFQVNVDEKIGPIAKPK